MCPLCYSARLFSCQSSASSGGSHSKSFLRLRGVARGARRCLRWWAAAFGGDWEEEDEEEDDENDGSDGDNSGGGGGGGGYRGGGFSTDLGVRL